MALVKCPHCEQRFDREVVKNFVLYKNRYYHGDCYDRKMAEIKKEEKEKEEKKLKQANKKEKEKIDKVNLENFIKDLFGVPTLSYVMKAQIKRYVEKEGFTYSGIHGTLNYFFVLKGNSTKNAQGIGIVPYVYEDAKKYYTKKAAQEKANAGFDGQLSVEVKVAAPQVTATKMTKRRVLVLEEED